MFDKTNKTKEKTSRTAGYTLTELTVTIAILGILAAAAVPELGGLTEMAKDRTNRANAKLLTNIAQMIEVRAGSYPDWPAEFSNMVPGEAYNLVNSAVTYQGTGHFSYNSAAGTVTAESGGVPE